MKPQLRDYYDYFQHQVQVLFLLLLMILSTPQWFNKLSCFTFHEPYKLSRLTVCPYSCSCDAHFFSPIARNNKSRLNVNARSSLLRNATLISSSKILSAYVRAKRVRRSTGRDCQSENAETSIPFDSLFPSQITIDCRWLIAKLCVRTHRPHEKCRGIVSEEPRSQPRLARLTRTATLTQIRGPCVLFPAR